MAASMLETMAERLVAGGYSGDVLRGSINGFEKATSLYRAEIAVAPVENLLPIIDTLEAALIGDAANREEPLYRAVVAISNIGSHSLHTEVKERAIDALFHYIDAQRAAEHGSRVDGNHIGRIAKTDKGGDLAIATIRRLHEYRLPRPVDDVTQDAVEHGYWMLAREGINIVADYMDSDSLRFHISLLGSRSMQDYDQLEGQEDFQQFIASLNEDGRMARLIGLMKPNRNRIETLRSNGDLAIHTYAKRMTTTIAVLERFSVADNKLLAISQAAEWIPMSSSYREPWVGKKVGIYGAEEIVGIALSSPDEAVRQAAREALLQAKKLTWEDSEVALAVGPAITEGLRVLS